MYTTSISIILEIFAIIEGMLLVIVTLEWQIYKIRNKQIIQELQKRIAIECSYRHDFEKKLRLLDKEGNPLVKIIIAENEKQINMERLPEYPKKVIESYFNEFKQNKIKFNLNIKEPILKWNLSLNDTISVLGNLIENAIEALEDVQSDKKWIEIVLNNLQDDRLQLRISNPFVRKEQFEEEIIKKGVSIKGKERGYGLYIVEKKVRGYRGEFRIYIEDDVFIAIIDF